MAEIDDLFRRPNAATNKRKLEVSHDPAQFYKSARISLNGDAKGGTHTATVEDDAGEVDEDVEAGPALPPGDDEDEADDEDGRFFGGGVDANTSAAIEYIDKHDAENEREVEEKFDIPWLRKTALNFEKRISKNAELRAKYEDEPAKFMASEADLDEAVKELSILSEHPELYGEFTKLGSVASLVSLLAHENTDIANAVIQIISELTDEDVDAEQGQWDALVVAALDADLLSLLVSNFSRFDESDEADRDGLYNSLSVLENVAGQQALATRIGKENALMQWLLSRIQKKEVPITQNTQYAAELLAILLQAAAETRAAILSTTSKANGAANGALDTTTNPIDILLTLLSPYRRADPSSDSVEEEYAENLFAALDVLLDVAQAKQLLIDAEGVELLLIMLREGKMAKPRALRALDHACSGSSGGVACEQLVEAQGLKTLFGMLMKSGKKGKEQLNREGTEHLLGILASMLRLLPSDSAPRIRLLAKFVEKDYEKLARLIEIRRSVSSQLSSVERQIESETQGLSMEEKSEREFDDLGRRLDAGLFILQTIDIILAWLVAEDGGARQVIVRRLAERDDTLSDVRRTLQEQLGGITEEDSDDSAEDTKAMLITLISFLA